MAPAAISRGVLVTDGARLLLGHATRSPRWDVFKGVAGPGEAFGDAAARELREETGLIVAAAALRPLGRFDYLPRKDLVLFRWRPPVMPDPATLRCTALVARGGFPELDRFALFDWDAALARVGKGLARVLAGLDRAGWGDAG